MLNKRCLWFLIFCVDLYAKTTIYFSFSFDNQGRPVSNDLSKQICEKILQAKSRIFMAMYAFTNKDISDAIIKAKQNNPSLDIQVIIDKFSLTCWGKARLLDKAGILVLLFDQDLFLQTVRGLKKDLPEQDVVLDSLQDLQIQNNRIPEDFFKLKLELDEPKTDDSNDLKVVNKDFFSSIMHNKYLVLDDSVWFGSYNFTKGANFRNPESAAYCQSRHKARLFVQDFEGLKKFCSPLPIENRGPKLAKNQKPKKIKEKKKSPKKA